MATISASAIHTNNDFSWLRCFGVRRWLPAVPRPRGQAPNQMVCITTNWSPSCRPAAVQLGSRRHLRGFIMTGKPRVKLGESTLADVPIRLVTARHHTLALAAFGWSTMLPVF